MTTIAFERAKSGSVKDYSAFLDKEYMSFNSKGKCSRNLKDGVDHALAPTVFGNPDDSVTIVGKADNRKVVELKVTVANNSGGAFGTTTFTTGDDL